MPEILNCGQYSLLYEVNNEAVTIVGSEGVATEIAIPSEIDNHPVCHIEKKAFMGNRIVKSIALPETIKELGDWSFAHCDMLKEVSLFPKEIVLGRGVFLNSEKLASANLTENPKDCAISDEERRQLSGLLASTLTVLEAPFLFTPESVGSAQWLLQYEARVKSFLERDDMEDYAKTVSCGEEDYESTNLESFLSDKRKAKVRMILIRLLNPYALSEEAKEHYQEYLRMHMPPGDMDETWQVVRDEHGDEEGYYEVLTQAGCVLEDNVQTLIAQLPNTRAQMRAYLLRYQQEHLTKKDFFDSFSL